jgi:hypothetical protein
MVIGCHPQSGRYEVAWGDTFHIGTAMMFSVGDATAKEISVLGAFDDLSGAPNWRRPSRSPGWFMMDKKDTIEFLWTKNIKKINRLPIQKSLVGRPVGLGCRRPMACTPSEMARTSSLGIG